MEETKDVKNADKGRFAEETRAPHPGSRAYWLRRRAVMWAVYATLAVGLFEGGMLSGRLGSTKVRGKPNQAGLAVAARARRLKHGPWGDLEVIPIYIEPPEEYLPIQEIAELDSRWLFQGYSLQKLTSLFGTIRLPPEETEELLEPSRCLSTTNGMVVRPPREVILSLSPEQRKQIYGILNQGPGMPIVWFPADSFEERFERDGLSKETIAMVRRLCFPRGRLLFFGDTKTVFETLDNYDEKVALLGALLRRHTLLLKLHVDSDTNIDSLLNYWGRAAQGKDLRPLLQSLAHIPGGASVDLMHLLPPVPKTHLYMFPPPSSDPVVSRHDCNWIAFNFFRDPPDERFTQREHIENTLQTDYYPISSEPRYGDILLLQSQSHTIIHTAVFIADNIVYTKNGSTSEPFLLMTIQDLLDTFAAVIPEGQQLGIVYLRNKYY